MKILILSNFDDESKLEDLLIAGSFEKEGHEVTMTTVNYSEELEDIYDIIIRRNTWFDEETSVEWYHGLMREIKKRVKEKNKICINFSGIFDTSDKKYLVKLFQENLPVIPTINPDMSIDNLPTTDFYLLKPLDSYDGFGQIRVSKNELEERLKTIKPNQYVVQPHINIKSEIQFYFVNDKLEYAFQFMPNKLSENVVRKEYDYSDQEANIASKFAKLNPDFVGVQRIDFIQDTNDNLLLLEIEDAAPFLSLQYISSDKRKQFIDDYKKMVYDYYKKNSTKC